MKNQNEQQNKEQIINSIKQPIEQSEHDKLLIDKINKETFVLNVSKQELDVIVGSLHEVPAKHSFLLLLKINEIFNNTLKKLKE